MRILLISDVHGNLAALRAVLADADRQGHDYVVNLGDLVAFGPEPKAVLSELATRSPIATIRGNTDRYVLDAAPRNQDASPPAGGAEITRTFGWSAGHLALDELKYLGGLPFAASFRFLDLPELLLVHASPESDEVGMSPDDGDDHVRRVMTGVTAAVTLCGHTHRPLDREIDGRRVFNPGSVGLPMDGDRRAAYAILDGVDGRWQVTVRRVEYDVDGVVQHLRRLGYPGHEVIVSRLLRAALE